MKYLFFARDVETGRIESIFGVKETDDPADDNWDMMHRMDVRNWCYSYIPIMDYKDEGYGYNHTDNFNEDGEDKLMNKYDQELLAGYKKLLKINKEKDDLEKKIGLK